MYLITFLGTYYNRVNNYQRYIPMSMDNNDITDTLQMLWMIDDVVLHVQRFVFMYLLMQDSAYFPDITDILDYIEIDVKDAEKELKKISDIVRNEPIDVEIDVEIDDEIIDKMIPFEDFSDYIVSETWDPLNMDNIEEVD